MKPRDYRRKDKKKPSPQDEANKMSIDNNSFLNRKIVSPEKLKILVLSGNDLVNEELDFVGKCISLLKQDLSNNKITRISKKLELKNIVDLKVMHMHNNRIDRIEGLEGVLELHSLIYFTVHENPIMSLPKIEHLIVNMITSLRVLNARVIMIQERSPEILSDRPEKFVDEEFLEGWKSSSVSQVYYIKVLQMQLNYIQNVWLRHNPIVLIQRVWKAIVRQRRALKKEKQSMPSLEISREMISGTNMILKEAFSTWKQSYLSRKIIRLQLKHQEKQKDLQHLTFPLSKYRLAKRNLRLQEYVQNVLKRIRHRIYMKRMCSILVYNLKIRVYNFNHEESFYNVCEIATHNRIYFARNQKHLLDNFLAHVAQKFNFREQIYSNTSSDLVKHYLSIRMVDPEAVDNKKCSNVLTYLIWPSMRVIFLRKRRIEGKVKRSLINIKPLLYIKNRDKVLTSQQYAKSSQLFHRISRFVKNEYENSLMYFECKNQEVMKILIRYIFYHNTKKLSLPNILPKNKVLSLLENFEEPFVFYNEKVMARAAAAVKIQQNWRKYICIKNQKTSIYSQMKKNRAILRVQRFFRDAAYLHRLSFHKTLKRDLQQFDEPNFLIHQSIYNNILELTKQSLHFSLYRGAKLIRTKSRIDLEWEFDIYPFSKSFIETQFTKRSSEIYQRLKPEKCEDADVYQLLHLGAKVNHLTYNGHKFIRFTYQSVQETKLRICLLALLSYRINGSKFILPVAKDSFDNLPQIILKYRRFKCLRQSIPELKNITKIDGMNKLTEIKEISENDGLFLFTQEFQSVKSQHRTLFVQFYQKKFNDFPLKYIGDIRYWFRELLPENNPIQENEKDDTPKKEKAVTSTRQILRRQIKFIEEQAQIIRQNKQSIDQASNSDALTSKLHERSDRPIENRKRSQNKSKDNKSQTSKHDGFITITKVDKKRLSLYDVGFSHQKEEESQQHHPHTSFQQSRQPMIETARKDEIFRREVQRHKRKNELHNLREKTKKDKTINETIKNMKQIERTQELRKRVERVKEFKQRASSLKKVEEGDFLQQGNFVMEQQLKMVIMRNKFKDRENKIAEKSNTTFTSKNFPLNRMGKTMSVVSKTEDVREKYRSKLVDDEVQGQEREIHNTRASFNSKRKTRNSSIGAYIRDPAFVHGVFPEQYYPIESRGNMQILFPPI